MMPKNNDLYKVAVAVLMSHFECDLRSQLEDKVQVRVDTQKKIRLSLGDLILYAYDFREGTQAIYETAVQNTRDLGDIPGTENLLTSGTVSYGPLEEMIFGWYLTTIAAPPKRKFQFQNFPQN